MNSNNSKFWRGRVSRYAPLILWASVVLFASTGSASMSETSRFIRPLLHFLFSDTPEETLIIYHAYIRKCAHFVEYAGLAFFASRAFWNSSVKLLRKYWFAFAFLIVVFIALIDEYNQSFNPERTGSFYDILLDCSGGLTMILLFFLYKFSVRKDV